MYGGASKLGRGGGGRGGGGPRRSSFPPPPPHRPSSAATTGRLSLGSGPRNRTTGAAASAAPAPAVEESFSLVSGNNPLAFSMIIRLAPDLVDEIRRLEAQGGTAKIKFDSIANNPGGNVIDVGGKVFRFTWSREFGDLCDIYEERQSGEDGNGLLVESGCAWRKLNVQRVLDESTKNHVKMRSEEAERKHKSRKAIVLDHGNPSMKNQIKQLAAAEASPWKSHFKQKKEPPFKKRKVDPPQATAIGGLVKPSFKPGLASAAGAKNRRSTSPLPSPPERPGAPVSPIGTGNITKSHAGSEDVIPSQVKSKETATSSEKDIPTRTVSAVREMSARKGNSGAKPTDLQSMLITLLKENPKGMSLKSLEKAVGDAFPNSAKKIEPIIKKIATFQAPGRYLLRQGVELDSFKKPSSESGSSPEDNHHQSLPPEEKHGLVPTPLLSSVEKVSFGELEEQTQSNSKFREESNAGEQIDHQQHSPDLVGDRKASDNSEGQAGSASDSGSDSDSESDSSDSGSDSGSHSSRSGSPAGSGSGSSSDSESDASSSSKEGSDEDVDIMTSDDDKEPKNDLQASASPAMWQTDDVRPLQNGVDANQDGDGSDAVDIEGHVSDAVDIEGHGSDAVDIEGHGSDAVDIEKDLPGDEQESAMAVNASLLPDKEGEKPVERTKPLSYDHGELQERQNFIGNFFDGMENTVNDSFRHEHSDSSERTSKGKSKRGYDLKHLDNKPERSKRSKVESLTQPISGCRDAHFFGSHHNSSPNRPMDDVYHSSSSQMLNKAEREANANFGYQKGYDQVFPAKSSSDFQQSSRRPFDQSTWLKASDTAEMPNKHAESSGYGFKISEKNVNESYPVQRDKASRDTQAEDSHIKEKKMPRNLKEGGIGGKYSVPSDLHNRRHGENVGKFKDTGQFPNSQMESSPRDNSRVTADRYPVNGRSSMLQRELSDLELGELREPLPDASPVKKQFERKGSFKQSESKPGSLENSNSDLSKGKPVGKTTWDSGKLSPPNLSVGVKRTPEPHGEELTRGHHRGVQSQAQHLSRVDLAEVGSHFNKSADASNKFRQNDTGAKAGPGLEGYGENLKKAPGGAPLESKRGSMSHSIKENKTLTSNTVADLIDGRKDAVLAEGNMNGQNKRGSSSDEDICSYSKYAKDVPEDKGPIKDFSQYKQYVQEYHDKYSCYCSLNKILESYRNEFEKLGKDLEFSKGRDVEKYHKTLGQLKDSYQRCGTEHKRMKKVFVVLHEELKNLKQRIKDYAVSRKKD